MRHRILRPIVQFAQAEATSGILLAIMAAVAMAWANFGVSGHYDAFWGQEIAITLGHQTVVAHSLQAWVNDAFMALFFLLMGLEIKREFLIGELSDRRRAMLPILCAIGGMAVPAGIYAAINANGMGSRGAGVPMATDIAFSLGVLALLGRRIPLALRIFLAAVAIVDDLGSILVIAIFYTAQIHGDKIIAAAVCLAILALMNRSGVRSRLAYFAVGFAMWIFVWASGIHATVAGMLLAMTVPLRTSNPDSDPAESTLEQMEDGLSPWVTFLVVPLFALANAGVVIGGVSPWSSPIGVGIIAGLAIGKPLGILLAATLAIKLGIAYLPDGVTRRHLAGVAILAGIGFTMSLFIADLAFDNPMDHQVAKIAILGASVGMGALGYLTLRFGGQPAKSNTNSMSMPLDR